MKSGIGRKFCLTQLHPCRSAWAEPVRSFFPWNKVMNNICNSLRVCPWLLCARISLGHVKNCMKELLVVWHVFSLTKVEVFIVNFWVKGAIVIEYNHRPILSAFNSYYTLVSINYAYVSIYHMPFAGQSQIVMVTIGISLTFGPVPLVL